jgi:hypothetical protein
LSVYPDWIRVRCLIVHTLVVQDDREQRVVHF